MDAVEWLELYANLDSTTIGEDLAVGVICGLRAEVKRLKQSHDFDAKRLSVLAKVAACAGTVLGMICRSVERLKQRGDGRELECKECKELNFVELCHEARLQAAREAMEIILNSATPPAILYASHREYNAVCNNQECLVEKIKTHFGLEE